MLRAPALAQALLHMLSLVIVAIGASVAVCHYMALLEGGFRTRNSNAGRSSCRPISLLQACDPRAICTSYSPPFPRAPPAPSRPARANMHMLHGHVHVHVTLCCACACTC